MSFVYTPPEWYGDLAYPDNTLYWFEGYVGVDSVEFARPDGTNPTTVFASHNLGDVEATNMAIEVGFTWQGTNEFDDELGLIARLIDVPFTPSSPDAPPTTLLNLRITCNQFGQVSWESRDGGYSGALSLSTNWPLRLRWEVVGDQHTVKLSDAMQDEDVWLYEQTYTESAFAEDGGTEAGCYMVNADSPADTPFLIDYIFAEAILPSDWWQDFVLSEETGIE